MERIRSELQSVFRRIFDDELVITEETTAANVDGWDSMAHINLIIAIEKQNVGTLMRLVASKTAATGGGV